MSSVIFPAKFSPEILDVLARIVPDGGIILDPFAGTGQIQQLRTDRRRIIGVEIEPELAALDEHTICGDMFEVLEADEWQSAFLAVVTSPTYGNRFADSHNAQDGSVRRSYTHDLRRMTGDPTRKLNPNNSGAMHFGPRYIDFHRKAWQLCFNVIQPGGLIFVNVKNFIRRGKCVPVVSTHRGLLKRAGFTLIGEEHVETPGLRYGENYDARVEYEAIIIGRKPL